LRAKEGGHIVFSTRPANTVAGGYYDVFLGPARTSGNSSYLVAVADVAGKSILAALLMAKFQASFFPFGIKADAIYQAGAA
jgi:phosphoserine phosphatase RsbU/P